MFMHDTHRVPLSLRPSVPPQTTGKVTYDSDGRRLDDLGRGHNREVGDISEHVDDRNQNTGDPRSKRKISSPQHHIISSIIYAVCRKILRIRLSDSHFESTNNNVMSYYAMTPGGA